MIPLFLYKGPEFGLKNEAIEKHKMQAEKKYGSLDFHLLYAQDISVREVLTIIQGGSLFADALFVVLRNAELIKNKEDIELLRNWVDSIKSNGYEDAYLFLVSDENSVDKKLENIIPKANARDLEEIPEHVKKGITFYPVTRMEEVIEIAFKNGLK